MYLQPTINLNLININFKNQLFDLFRNLSLVQGLTV